MGRRDDTRIERDDDGPHATGDGGRRPTTDAAVPTDDDGGRPQSEAARPRRRGAPWLLGGLVLALLFVLVALQVFGLWEFITPDTAADTLLVYALSTLN